MSVVHGDCLDVMATLDAESIDAIVTDPPYGLEFMGKDWDRLSADPNIGKSRRAGFDAVDGPRDKRSGNEGGTWFGSRDAKVPNYHRATNAKCRICGKWRVSGGHDGKGNTLGCHCERPDFPNVAADAARRMGAWHEAWAAAAFRVAKPGAYLLAFGGTRTVHRMTCAIEDAGWIIRDMLVWGYASGFPKGKANLKPAWEPIVMARKPGPLRPLAIDGCRIGWAGPDDVAATEASMSGQRNFRRVAAVGAVTNGPTEPDGGYVTPSGRWPANVLLTDPIFDGGWDGVVGGGESKAGGPILGGKEYADIGYHGNLVNRSAFEAYGDPGTYSRFFLVPKAARSDREPVLGGLEERRVIASVHGGMGDAKNPNHPRANVHPTVKPTELMRHLVRLVTPSGGVVLDPFLGSGSTALAAEQEGFAWIGIEKEASYVEIAEARLNGTQRGLAL